MSSTQNKVITANEIDNDTLFQHILKNNSYRNIHYYAAGTIVYNYFGKKLDESQGESATIALVSQGTVAQERPSVRSDFVASNLGSREATSEGAPDCFATGETLLREKESRRSLDYKEEDPKGARDGGRRPVPLGPEPTKSTLHIACGSNEV
jgi:hypothetical protein